MGAELFHADGRDDFANAPKNSVALSRRTECVSNIEPNRLMLCTEQPLFIPRITQIHRAGNTQAPGVTNELWTVNKPVLYEKRGGTVRCIYRVTECMGAVRGGCDDSKRLRTRNPGLQETAGRLWKRTNCCSNVPYGDRVWGRYLDSNTLKPPPPQKRSSLQAVVWTEWLEEARGCF